jgi:peptide/nickel transport system substrate-binding protein
VSPINAPATAQRRVLRARILEQEVDTMKAGSRVLAAASSLTLALLITGVAFAQKAGGILKISHFDSPASMSLLEESTAAALRPVMGVFNNLVLYDQHVAQNSMRSIVPELATSWSSNEEGTELTFPLRQGVKWHDGKPFSAQDVKCTWDLLSGKASEKLRINPRKSWYSNVEEVTTNGNYEVTFRLKRPQPALLALLASGWAPIYPCHVSPRDMRSRPIGTGPFKFVEFKPNEVIRVTRNPDYWKEGRPYLDGIEWAIIKDVSTRNLAFIAGKVDLYSPHNITIPIVKAIKSQAPQAICEVAPTNVNRTLIINRDKAPFDNADLRRAMSLTLDRKAFIDIITEGQGDIGGTMLPGPEGVWSMPPELLKTLPGYDPDVGKNRAEARKILEKLGYGPDKRLAVTVSTRNVSGYRDAAVILIDQLKEIYIDGQLETVDTTQWYPKIMRKDFTVGLNVSESAVDDPDQQFYENYVCTAERNYTGYCSPEVDQLVDRQSAESDKEKRKRLVWEIERRLAQDGARPVIFYPRQATCWHPHVKGMTMMVNSIYNGFRYEDLWLD